MGHLVHTPRLKEGRIGAVQARPHQASMLGLVLAFSNQKIPCHCKWGGWGVISIGYFSQLIPG